MSFSSKPGRKSTQNSNSRLPVPRTPTCSCRPKRSASKGSKITIPKIALIEASTTTSDVTKETQNTSGSVLQILPPSYGCGTSSCSQELACTSIYGPFQPAIEKKTELTDKLKYSLSQSSVPRRTGQCSVSCSTSFGSPLAKSSFEKLVEEELKLATSKLSEHPPRVISSRPKVVSPPILMITAGPEPATHQITLNRSVRRLPDKEIINRHITDVQVDQCGCAHQTEVNIQSVEPSRLPAEKDGGVKTREAPLKELISTSSSLTAGAGGKSKTTTTIYEALKKISKDEQETYRSKIKTVEVCDRAKIGSPKTKQRNRKSPERRSPPKPSPIKMTEPSKIHSTKITRLVEEENRDVEKMKGLQPPRLKGSFTDCYGLKKRLDKIRVTEGASRLGSSVASIPPTPEEREEEVQPEVMAALMHTEERGLDMEASPANVYNYLFPDSKNDLVIKISSVAPAPLQNVVVPVDVQSDLHAAGVTPEIRNIVKYTNNCMLPVDNIYEKSVLKTDKAVPTLNNTALKGKKTGKSKKSPPSDNIMNTSPPWKDEDLEPMINLVGASPSTAFTADDASEAELSTVVHNRLDNSLEYNLIPQSPRHVSRVQLRGTQNPAWFPGYYIALPDSIRVVKSPSEVLPAAWQAVQPDIFAEDSFLVVR